MYKVLNVQHVKELNMQWISVDIDSPNVDTLGGKEILILVKDKVFLCSVMKKPIWGVLEAYITDNNFLYSEKDGWSGDARFSKPTHWMPLPEPPHAMD